jgi:hypothetical protein
MRNGYVLETARPITVSANQKAASVQIAMTLAGVIHGRIYDQKGRPLVNAEVQALKISYEGGVKAPKLVRWIRTNDLGEYRIFGLPAGRYYVSGLHPDGDRYTSTSPGGIRPGVFPVFMAWGRQSVVAPSTKREKETYVPIFFPNSADELYATPVHLSPGTEIGNIDITLFPVQMRRVRGVIIDGNTGQPVRNARLSVSRTPARVNDDPYIGVDSALGSFEVSSVLPGSYTFLATAGELTGRISVDVAGENVDDVALTLMRGFNIPGRLLAESNQIPFGDFRVNLRSDPDIRGVTLPSSDQNGVPTREGSFSLLRVPSGDYHVQITIPPDFPSVYLKSVRLGAVDVLKDGLRIDSQIAERLDVLVGINAGTLSGRVVDPRQQPAQGSTVVVFPQGDQKSRADLVRKSSTDAAGQFRFDGLAPGDYKLFAWNSVEAEAWTDPDFLSIYENEGTWVHIVEGASLSINALTVLANSDQR